MNIQKNGIDLRNIKVTDVEHKCNQIGATFKNIGFIDVNQSFALENITVFHLSVNLYMKSEKKQLC